MNPHKITWYLWHPMLLIEINSINNMGCQKIKVVQSLQYYGYLTNTSWCVWQVAGISKRSNDKQKSCAPKKNQCVTIRDCKKSDFLNSDTC